MIRLGLIGYPLGHSFSATYFAEKFGELGIEGSYELIPVPSYDDSTLSCLLSTHPSLDGFNVTAPWKQRIITDLDRISADAKEIGGVNVVKVCREDNGSVLFEGYNTDWRGFIGSIPEHYFAGEAVILGSGGAARAAAYALLSRGVTVRMVSRDPAGHARNNSDVLSGCHLCGYEDLVPDVMERCSLLVNATPLGTFPKCDECPDIPYHLVHEGMLCYDMVYNPAETLFMKRCDGAGAAVMNGLEMLKRQADLAWEIWNS